MRNLKDNDFLKISMICTFFPSQRNWIYYVFLPLVRHGESGEQELSSPTVLFKIK